MIKQLTIIGLGLIGGSVAQAIKPTQFCKTIVAYDQDEQALVTAKKLQIIDDYTNDIANAVNNADLILLATPLGQISSILTAIKSNLKDQTIITDVCSVKASVVAAAQRILGSDFSNFVPGHPIAGSEKSGITAATANLFTNRLVILTPTADTNVSATEVIQQFWQQMGAKTELMEANLHDRILAATSHLPQMLAYTFMHDIAQKNYPNIFHYAGSGLKDFTRLAGSNPDLWLDICKENRPAILEELEQFQQQLSTLQRALKNQDYESLFKIFTSARTAKKQI